MVNQFDAAVSRCSQCGLCLADCPTYAVTGLEADSPRGRIQALALGTPPEAMAEADFAGFWNCLACGDCLDVCPTGVDVVGAYRAARVHRPGSSAERVAELAGRRADLLADDPGIAATVDAVLRRASGGPPSPGTALPPATLLVAGDLVPGSLVEQAMAVTRRYGHERVDVAPAFLAGASGLLLDAGLGPLHEAYTAAVREACRRAPADLRLVALDAEAWRLAPLVAECGAVMVTLPAFLAERARPAAGGAALTADFGLAEDDWRVPLERLTGRQLAWPAAEHRAAAGPVVIEERALEILRDLGRAFVTSLAGTALTTADVRTLARAESAVFYLDHLAPPDRGRAPSVPTTTGGHRAGHRDHPMAAAD